jgi:hypothetical protein
MGGALVRTCSGVNALTAHPGDEDPELARAPRVAGAALAARSFARCSSVWRRGSAEPAEAGIGWEALREGKHRAWPSG